METGRESPSSTTQPCRWPPSCEDAISVCDLQGCCYGGGEGYKLTPAFNSLILEIICVSTAPNPLDRTSNMMGGREWGAGKYLEFMDIDECSLCHLILYQTTETKLRSSQRMRTGNQKGCWDQRIWSNQ